MTTYKLYRSIDGQIQNVLRNDKDSIPFDPANTDYQEYLAWVTEGNTPLSADDNGGGE
jgi:hypothetical protein